MKKVIASLVFIGMLFSGCGSSDDKDSKLDSNTTEMLDENNDGASSASETNDEVIDKVYETVYDINHGTFSMLYKYNYDGADLQTMTFTIDKVELVGSKMTAVSDNSYPIYTCADDTDDFVKNTVEADTIYEWDYLCMGKENSSTSYYTMFAFSIDNDGDVKGVFEKDTDFTTAVLNVYNNWDGVVVGTISNADGSSNTSNAISRKNYYIPSRKEVMGDIETYLNTAY
jgi:hypothetical protein